MTALGPKRDTYLRDTSESISEAAKHSPLPVEWFISYSTRDFSAENLSYVENLHRVDTKLISVDGPMNAATGRNHAIMHADKKALMVNCDSDDLFTPERFQLIDTDCKDVISLCGVNDYVDGEVIEHGTIRGGIYEHPWWEESVESNEEGTPHFKYHLATLAIPRDIALFVGGYPSLDYMEDTVFAKIVHDRFRPRLAIYPDVGYLYRKHPDQLSNRNYDRDKLWKTWVDHKHSN